MAISGTIKAKQLNGVVPYGSPSAYSRYIEIDVEDLDISEAVKADEIVNEYNASDLLEAIGTNDVIRWLESEGFTISAE